MTYAEFEAHVAAHRPTDGRRLAVPVSVRRSADLLTPVSAYLALRGEGETAFLLESVEGGERLGRYSFLGARPALVVEAREGRVRLHRSRRPSRHLSGDGMAPVDAATGSPFEVLDSLLGATVQAPVPGLPPFTGGAVGFFGYDCVRMLERLPDAPHDSLGLPDAVWGFYDAVAAFDHVRHQLVLIATAFVDDDTTPEKAYTAAQERLADLEATLAGHMGGPGEPIALLDQQPRSNVTQAAFEESVRVAQRHIHEGDVFQLVLSQRLAVRFTGDPFNLYRALRQVNPSPHLYHLDFAGLDAGPFSLVGSSPERLVRVTPEGHAARAEVMPIAGTRRRGKTASEDTALEAELVADPKEQAEHLMLVDLGRNDLGRVCATGTVEVERYAKVERFSHVMHLVSSVAGTVADRSAVDVLSACFPAGTVTGAPKVRAMELIDGLETERRGPYAGAVGYAGYDGALDTALAIRTLLVRPPDGDLPGTAYVQAGAGVVADSDPTAEYHETLHKANALVEALGVAATALL